MTDREREKERERERERERDRQRKKEDGSDVTIVHTFCCQNIPSLCKNRTPVSFKRIPKGRDERERDQTS